MFMKLEIAVKWLILTFLEEKEKESDKNAYKKKYHSKLQPETDLFMFFNLCKTGSSTTVIEEHCWDALDQTQEAQTACLRRTFRVKAYSQCMSSFYVGGNE